MHISLQKKSSDYFNGWKVTKYLLIQVLPNLDAKMGLNTHTQNVIREIALGEKGDREGRKIILITVQG